MHKSSNYLLFQVAVWKYGFCHFYICIEICAVLCLAAQLCPTLCNPMDCSPPGSCVHADSSCKNMGVGCHALLQGIFPTQGLNPGLLHCRWDSFPSEPSGLYNVYSSLRLICTSFTIGCPLWQTLLVPSYITRRVCTVYKAAMHPVQTTSSPDNPEASQDQWGGSILATR